MHFLRSVLLATACSTLTLSVSAAPTPASSELSARDVDDVALERRIFGSLGKLLTGTQQGQARKQEKSDRKRKTNQKISQSVPKVRASAHDTEGLSSSERARKHQEANDRERARAITRAQKQAKEDRKSRWSTPSRSDRPSGSGRTRYASPDRRRASSALRSGGERMYATENIPHRSDTFRVGGFQTDGRHVRQAVTHSIVHASDPVGRGDNRAPKEFRNDPYGPTHYDVPIRGTRPISGGAGRTMYEYPVTPSHQRSGYTGSGRVGPARVITSHDGGRDVFHGVIGHDRGRGGDDDDHYRATYVPGPSSSYHSSRYD